MRQKLYLILGIAVVLILSAAGAGFSQEAEAVEETPLTETLPEAQMGLDTQWLWGGVVSVDVQNNELLVKYLDYETDQEKEITISVDDKTTYENIGSLIEIKPQDTVSIDYLVSAEGKNVAKNISVEKPETMETLPEDLQPPAPVGD